VGGEVKNIVLDGVRDAGDVKACNADKYQTKNNPKNIETPIDSKCFEDSRKNTRNVSSAFQAKLAREW